MMECPTAILVIGGRDQQQNELIVKRYLKTNDIYVHAGIVGASSVVIKNPNNEPIPLKTLTEAGTMAMCYSTAWEAKVVTSAWWVHANQVSKTAPTGEYLTTGSFMIRGKKNFLPQCHLVMGFTFLFKLEDGSVERHKDERKKKEVDESSETNATTLADEDVELHASDSDDDENIEEDGKTLTSIEEEAAESSFPDTQVLVEHKKYESSVKVKILEPKIDKHSTNDIDSDYVVYLGDDTPIIIKPPDNALKQKKTPNMKTVNENLQKTTKEELKEPQKQKRGHKSKLKKIKEKYRDQDDEERELRMMILQGCPRTKEKKNKKKDKGSSNTFVKKEPVVKVPQVQLPHEVKKLENALDEPSKNQPPETEVDEDEEKEDTTDLTLTADVEMLHSLTGQPLPEDDLLFAVPVVAPYSALINYKYKVKLTPGTGKRGKSAKTALNVFLKDKTASQREKDMLKFVKDQDLARNFPGKVKISAPQLNKYK